MKEYTTLSEELAKLSSERQEKIKARASRLYLEELTFKYLQEKLGVSEAELAQYFNEPQRHILRRSSVKGRTQRINRFVVK